MADHLLGFFSSWIVYAFLLILHLFVPARTMDGYVLDTSTGHPYKYRINGLAVLLVAVAAWALLGRFRIVPYDWLYRHRWSGLGGAVALGLIASYFMVAGAPHVKSRVLVDFFLGRRFSPQFIGGRVDAKMFLYLIGATMLALNILSFAAYNVEKSGPSATIILYTVLFFWFLIDYMVFERVHLYTYDLVAERVGFKLTFGCIAFYPFFYLIGLWAVVERAPAAPSAAYLVISAAVFFSGWVLARGANMQKFVFKRDRERVFLGLIKPISISDGERHIICNGFWGLSRHINYLGEVLMATGLTLALGYPGAILGWLYPLYYIVLLTARQVDDDRRCREKYGTLWGEYEKTVRWRIIPKVY